MNTALPAPEEYFRLTRAEELRRKAARVERWASVLAWNPRPFAGRVLFGLLLLGLLLVRPVDGGAFALTPDLLTLAGLLLRYDVPRLFRRRGRRLHSEAAALQEAHQVRYGAALTVGAALPDTPAGTALSPRAPASGMPTVARPGGRVVFGLPAFLGALVVALLVPAGYPLPWVILLLLLIGVGGGFVAFWGAVSWGLEKLLEPWVREEAPDAPR